MADRKSIVHVKFRLRDQLLKRIEKAAKAADRSVNEEVQRRLEKSFDREDHEAKMEEIAKKAAAETVDKMTADYIMPPLAQKVWTRAEKKPKQDEESQDKGVDKKPGEGG